jgi:hypothetical protein
VPFAASEYLTTAPEVLDVAETVGVFTNQPLSPSGVVFWNTGSAGLVQAGATVVNDQVLFSSVNPSDETPLMVALYLVPSSRSALGLSVAVLVV